jgi:hypothetical protein
MGVEDYLGEVGPGSSPVTSYTGQVREGCMNDWGYITANCMYNKGGHDIC